ncbi:MAG: glycosyltransferase [Candidatus Saccharibacteria bacterium]|nr:glycosyltransferase [Pseudorhodobacter sp.]
MIPARNEADNIVGLVDEIDRAMAGLAPFEIIVVDDGSGDRSVARLQDRAATTPQLFRFAEPPLRPRSLSNETFEQRILPSRP